jgi:chloramphenicol 3-O phosphotransferase
MVRYGVSNSCIIYSQPDGVNSQVKNTNFMATIIFLNGTSSSGKSTLIKGLQAALDEPFLELGLDKFIWMLPKRYLNQPLWDEILGQADSAGELGHQLVSAMHHAIHSAASAGMNILADHVLVEPAWVSDCAEIFHDQQAYLVGVRCELSVLEQRERERRDRTLGQARKQYKKVHAHGMYDFEVDTGKYRPEETVQQLIDYLCSNPTPFAFKALKNRR